VKDLFFNLCIPRCQYDLLPGLCCCS